MFLCYKNAKTAALTITVEIWRRQKQSCSVSRHYFSKSRSRRSEVSVSVSSRHFEASENGHVSAVSFISSMELFQHPNMPKESNFKAALVMYNHWF